MKFDLSEFDHKNVVFVGVGKGRSMRGLQDFLETHGNIRSFTGIHKQEGAEPLRFLTDYDPASTIFFKNEAIPGDSMPVPYVTPLQLFFQLAHGNNLMTIGITGTKGKSTTTSLTADILRHAGKEVVLAGNIGISPLHALAMANPDTIFVLELSSYQLSDLDTSPHISACINLYNDHTDWHGSLEGYWEAKHNIMRYAQTNDVFIYNPDFMPMQEWAKDAVCRTIVIDPGETIDLSGARLFGAHNVLNALIAREIARQFDIGDDVSIEAIRSFVPLRHRMQIVATKHNRTYVDDAIGMTPESTIASMTAVTQTVGSIGCLLLGGTDRHYDFHELMQEVARYEIPHLVLFPETEDQMLANLPEDYQPEIHRSSDMADAVAYAASAAPLGTVVLLSTAAPSYVLWQDFEDKGDQFQAVVASL